jgi:hypothetical protein
MTHVQSSNGSRRLDHKKKKNVVTVTIMMNNMESKRERTRENQDTDLRSSAMCLPLQECGYILIYDLGLQHNIFISKPYYTYRHKNPKIPVPYCGALPPHPYNLIVPNRPLALRCSANWPLYWYF